MELIDVLQEIVARYMKGAGVTDLVIGTVTKAKPLEITVESSRLVLPAEVLKLTAAVVEKKLPLLAHSHSEEGLSHAHSYAGGATGSALTGSYRTGEELKNVACVENGKPLPVKDGYITLNRGLETGDKVLMLRVLAGQNYLVLSRVYERGK